ncbi:MAG: molybdenum hydroxylase [Desulfobacterales bacterium CG07_land_8_20_14_0_80_52_14]|nr:MAG: molybdenum hydroxylase [Desulfobacterales bacterium CG23_combo_of_CG06-09_8_20_14_all_52_9]PIU49222.1 MAG: molybdenum hydroxylase [Desulfobacterales bacterium CG07_land_8_20_14_0_80_52_14]
MGLEDLVIGIKGAGEMASAVAWRLFSARIRKLFMMEIEKPLAVRRKVCFCEAVYEKRHTVEGIEGVLAENAADIYRAWASDRIPVIVDPSWESVTCLRPHGVVDAIIAKENLGTRIHDAPLVIGLGPGFTAAIDVHFVIETQRGHDLGRIFTKGCALENTGVPGNIGGFTKERVLRAPIEGTFRTERAIGDRVQKGEAVAEVGGEIIRASIDGVIRGLLRPGAVVTKGLKLGDIDPRGCVEYCFTLSDKARAVAGSVLEVVCRAYNTGRES